MTALPPEFGPLVRLGQNIRRNGSTYSLFVFAEDHIDYEKGWVLYGTKLFISNKCFTIVDEQVVPYSNQKYFYIELSEWAEQFYIDKLRDTRLINPNKLIMES